MKNKAAVFLVLLLICFSFVFAFNGDVVLAEDTSAKSCVVVEEKSFVSEKCKPKIAYGKHNKDYDSNNGN